MGNNETEATSKPVKVLPLQQEQVALHSYPDWSQMQAYYSPGVGIPPPYFTSAVVPGHAPHPYVWGPQPMMPPFGTTYPAIYAPAGYPHPSLTLSPHARSQGNTSTASEAVTATTGTENAKSQTSSKDCGLLKKQKGFDGVAVSTSNDNCEKTGGSVNSQSQSEEDPDGSSNGSDENSEGNLAHKKRSLSADAPAEGKKGKEGIESSKEDVSPTISLGVAVGHPSIIGKTVGAPPPLGKPEVDLGVSSVPKPESIANPLPLSSTPILPMRDTMPLEHWIQDERELKRERRKQSNRESARRSRLRKQAETEELALKVEKLTSEKANLQTEISRLSEMSEKLRQENSALMENLKMLEGVESGLTLGEMGSKKSVAVGCENLLSKLGNTNSSDVNGQQEPEACENSGMKLHQLLEPSPRTDAVTAS